MTMRNIAGVATALSLAVVQAPQASALSLEDVAFHHSFEQGATADLARGKADPLQTLGAPEFVNAPGRDGKVMKLRSGRDALVFELDGNFNPEQGAISFYLSAVDWDGSNGDALQVLFHTDGTDQEQQLVVQTLWPWGNLFMPLYDRGALLGGFPAGRSCSAPLRQGKDLENVLKTGYFYHYVITWRDGYQALYLNGKLMAEARQPALRLRTLGRTFTLGWNRKAAKIFWDPGCEDKAEPLAAREWQSLIDDVTVLRSFVFPNEVARMHQYGALDYARRAEPRALAIETEFYQTRSVLGVQIVAPGDEPKKLALEVHDVEGARVHRQEVQLAAGENVKHVDLDLHAIPVGAYRVRASLISGFATDWIDFEKANPDWLGNDLGKADVVLQPWTPVEVKQTETAVEVGVWGRNYRYEGPLPAQIVSQEANLLSGPVHCVVNGKSVAWTPPKVGSATPTRVALSSTATVGAYALKGETRVEYDGFTWSTFTFRAEKPQDVDSLYVDIPLQRSESLFLQYPTRRDCFFPKENDWSSEWEPYVFVGSDERGLQWYAESDQWWHGKDRGQAIQVLQTKEGPVLRLNVIRDRVDMPAEFSLSFGLMGSPVRPRPANWRGWGTATRQRMGDHERFKPMGLDYSWWSVSPGWLVPNSRDPESQGRDPNFVNCL